MKLTFRPQSLPELSYRLMLHDDGWRVTRARARDDESVSLRHVRGGGGAAEAAKALMQLLATDFDSRYEEQVAELASVAAALRHGRRGFRPGSAVLKRRQDELYAAVDRQARAMGRDWHAARTMLSEALEAHMHVVLPEWLEAVILEAQQAQQPRRE